MDRELAAPNRGKPRWDSLEVSLHDVDLAHEVELLTHLMVAANETEHRLLQSDVDEILGVTANGAPDGVPGSGATTVNGGAGSHDGVRDVDADRTPDGAVPVVPAQRGSTD
jgi:hypothetical protein